MQSSSTGTLLERYCSLFGKLNLFPHGSGALGAGLAIFSRFPIVASNIHPYSLNGSPIDVSAGDWFVGKAAASVIIQHPILNEVQIFNTHVRRLLRGHV